MKINDPKFRINRLYRILGSSWVVDYKLTKSQEYILEQFLEHKRILVLKGRQIGASSLWCILALDMALFSKETPIVISAHSQALQVELFKKIKLWYEELMRISNGKIWEWGKCFDIPNTLYYTTTEISFDNKSSVKVVLEGTGYSMNHWHISELSKNQRAQEIFTNTLPALNKWSIFLESTAYGTTWMWKFFYDLYLDSINKRNNLHFVFCPWYWEDKYEEDYVWESFPEIIENARKHLQEYDLETQNRKLTWYNSMYRLQRWKLLQEYPSTPEEAFLSSGESIFDTSRINELRRDPLYYDWDTNYPKDSKDVDEGLRIYRKPSDCVIAIDPAGWNENWDYTSISVRDYERNLLAHYYWKANPEKTLWIIKRLDELGYIWVIVPELNATNGGVVMEKILNAIDERIISSQMYRRKRTQEDIKQWVSTKYAFDTNAKTRKEILENFIDLFDRWLLDEIDDRELHEMTHFHKNDSWKMIASTGEHDDAIMCDAICLYVVEQDVRYMIWATDRDIWI